MYTNFATPFLDLEHYELDTDIVNIIPKDLATKYKIIALDKMDNLLIIGITNIADKKLISFFEEQLNYKIISFLISLTSWEEIFPSAYIKKEPTLKWIG